MNDGLIDSFRHNTWATRQLLDACSDLTDEQLQTAAIGTYGSIIATFRHMVRADAGYSTRLIGEPPSWDYRDADDAPDLAELGRRITEQDDRWERFLIQPFDAERNFVIPWWTGTDYDVPSGIVLAQALHHANEHRTHICAILTNLGQEPPGIGLWEFAVATGRAQPSST